TERGLGSLSLRDILHLRDEILWCPVRPAKGRYVQQDVDGRPVLPDVALLAVVSWNLTASELAGDGNVSTDLVGMRDVCEPELRQLIWRVPGDLGQNSIDADEASVERHEGHSDGRLVDREAKPLLGLAQLRVGPLPLADISSERLPTTVGKNVRADLDGHERAVLPFVCPVGLADPAGHEELRTDCSEPLGIVGWNDVEERYADELTALIPKQPAGSLVDLDEPSVQIREKERVWREVDDGTGARLGVCRFLG